MAFVLAIDRLLTVGGGPLVVEGDQLWRSRLSGGDKLKRNNWSGGTNYRCFTLSGGTNFGGTSCSMTGPLRGSESV